MPFDAQPPHPGDSFDTIIGWEWASRITNAVRDLSNAPSSAGGFNTSTIITTPLTFADNVPLIMSNTTGAELVYRSADTSITLANALVDLLAINVTTKFATFSGSASFAGTVNATGAISSGSSISAVSSITAGSHINAGSYGLFGTDVHAGNNFQLDNGNEIVFNQDTFQDSFIRHTGAQMQFWGSTGMLFALNDSGGFQISGATFTSATAGGGSPLPAQPDRYLSFAVLGAGIFRVPLYL